MQTTLTHVTTFGKGGDAADQQLFGWSLPERGFTWTDGDVVGLLLPLPDAPNGFVIEVLAWPHRDGGRYDGQSLTLRVNDAIAGDAFVVERTRLAWIISPLAETARALVLTFHLPDAVVPSSNQDTRKLGLAFSWLRLHRIDHLASNFQSRVYPVPTGSGAFSGSSDTARLRGLGPKDIATRIESLGFDCTAGFFQRFCGVDPLGLFRFSGTVQHALLDGIDERFAQLGDATQIAPVPEETDLKDWIVYERRYLLRYHTWVEVSGTTREAVVNREMKRLPFLKRKFLEDLDAGEKLFLFHQRRTMPVAEVLPVYLAIRRQSSASILVLACVDRDHPSGLVKEILPGLMIGYVSGFKLTGPDDPLMNEWLGVCSNALLLTSGHLPQCNDIPAVEQGKAEQRAEAST